MDQRIEQTLGRQSLATQCHAPASTEQSICTSSSIHAPALAARVGAWSTAFRGRASRRLHPGAERCAQRALAPPAESLSACSQQ